MISYINNIVENDTIYLGLPQAIHETAFQGSPDYSLYNGSRYGQQVQRALGKIGAAYSVEVTDLGKSIVVRAGYHNTVTGRTGFKTFVILMDAIGTNRCSVFATSNKYRSCDSIDQAISYISMYIRSLNGTTSSS